MSLKLVDAEDVYRGKQKNQNSKSGANPDNEDYKRGYNSDSNNADDNIGGYNNDFGTREFGTKLRNDFCNGAITGLHFKLNEIANAKIQTGLVLVKKKTVEDYVNQKYSRLTHEKTKTVRRSDAYYEGVTYGRTMDINSSIR